MRHFRRVAGFAALAVGFAIAPLLIVSYGRLAAALLDRDAEGWARHDAAFEMTRSLYRAVELYRRDHQRVPDETEGLAALVPEYARAIPVDPWGNPFVYTTRGGDWADVVSLGADGAPGGSDLAADVGARYGSPGTAPPRELAGALVILLSLIPLAAYAASFWSAATAPALAGNALFWAWVAAATVAPNADLSLALIAALAAVLVASLGAVLTLRGGRGGATTALLGTLGCLTASIAMMG